MKKIVTLTMDPALDKSVGIEQVLPDRKLRCDPPRYDPGGGGVNVSRAIYRLGGSSVAYFTSGGPIGQMYRELLRKEDIHQHPLQIEGMTRENLTVLEGASGQQYRFVMPGPELAESEWQRCLEEVVNGESEMAYIVASGSLPRNVPTDFYGRLARLARKKGVELIVDTSGDALIQAAHAGVYLLKPNMRELAHLAGREFENEDQQERFTRELIKDGRAKIVVVSLGAAGVLFATAEMVERIPAPTVKIRSKIGAGDSMVAGIILALAQGRTPQEAVYYGVAAGTAAVMTPGTELCRQEDTERLYAEMRTKET